MAVFRKDGSDFEGVLKHVRKRGARYPVLFDRDSRNPKALGITSYPRAFLLDKAGVVVWEGPLWKQNLQQIEGQIREILADKRPAGTPRPGNRFRIAYLSWSPDSKNPVVLTVSPDGSDRREPGKRPVDVTTRTVSPDGKWVVFAADRDGDQEIYAMELDGKRLRRLTMNRARDGSPSWSPDGRQIAFVSDRDGTQEVYVMDADGSHQRRLTRSRGAKVGPVWWTR